MDEGLHTRVAAFFERKSFARKFCRNRLNRKTRKACFLCDPAAWPSVRMSEFMTKIATSFLLVDDWVRLPRRPQNTYK